MRTDQQLQRVSTALCYFLRHSPEDLGIRLTIEGYVPVDDFINKLNDTGTAITHDELMRIVETDSKGRYSLINGNTEIRCNQGHSTKQVNLTFRKVVPPALLFHGTADKNLPSIKKQGLHSGDRQYVHLSSDIKTAEEVGTRHGKVVVINIAAREMHDRGYKFYLSDNNVWLTDNVPPSFIERI